MLHCWEDGPRIDKPATEHDGVWGPEQWGTTCFLEAEHDGPHEWTRDDAIVVAFQQGGCVMGKFPKVPEAVRLLVNRYSRARGIDPRTLRGPRRHQHLTRVRRGLCVVLRAMGLSLKTIGCALGNRHHTTILHYLRPTKGMASAS